MRASKVSNITNSGVRKSRVSSRSKSNSPTRSPGRSGVIDRHCREEINKANSGMKSSGPVKRTKIAPAANSSAVKDHKTLTLADDKVEDIYSQMGRNYFERENRTVEEMDRDLKLIEEERAKRVASMKESEKKLAILRKQLDVAETGAEAANQATLPYLRKAAAALEYMQMHDIENYRNVPLDDITIVHLLATQTLLEGKPPYHYHFKHKMTNKKKNFIFVNDSQNKAKALIRDDFLMRIE